MIHCVYVRYMQTGVLLPAAVLAKDLRLNMGTT